MVYIYIKEPQSHHKHQLNESMLLFNYVECAARFLINY